MKLETNIRDPSPVGKAAILIIIINYHWKFQIVRLHQSGAVNQLIQTLTGSNLITFPVVVIR